MLWRIMLEHSQSPGSFGERWWTSSAVTLDLQDRSRLAPSCPRLKTHDPLNLRRLTMWNELRLREARPSRSRSALAEGGINRNHPPRPAAHNGPTRAVRARRPGWTELPQPQPETLTF